VNFPENPQLDQLLQSVTYMEQKRTDKHDTNTLTLMAIITQ